LAIRSSTAGRWSARRLEELLRDKLDVLGNLVRSFPHDFVLGSDEFHFVFGPHLLKLLGLDGAWHHRTLRDRGGKRAICLRGEIQRAAGLTVKECDKGVVTFARWNAFPSSPIEPRTREGNEPGSGEPPNVNAYLRSDRRVIPEAAE
jgi:hypothetical protein